MDADRFGLMRYSGPGVRKCQKWDTAVVAWEKRWSHWGNRGACGLPPVGEDVYMPYIRCFEEVGYQMNLARLVEHSRRNPAPSPHINFVGFNMPWDRVYAVSLDPARNDRPRREFWAGDIHREYRARIQRAKDIGRFVPWHCVESF